MDGEHSSEQTSQVILASADSGDFVSGPLAKTKVVHISRSSILTWNITGSTNGDELLPQTQRCGFRSDYLFGTLNTCRQRQEHSLNARSPG